MLGVGFKTLNPKPQTPTPPDLGNYKRALSDGEAPGVGMLVPRLLEMRARPLSLGFRV